MRLFRAQMAANEPLARMVAHFTVFLWGSILLLTLRPNASVLAQEEVVVTAKVDRNTIAATDDVTLTISVAGRFQQLDEPQLPLLNAFEIVGQRRSNQFSMVDGVVTSLTAFSYQLRPTVPSGSYIIEPIVILVDGSRYHTDPISIEVAEGATTYREPEPHNGQAESATNSSDRVTFRVPEGLTGQDLFVAAEVDSTSPSIGQQIVYRLRFFQAINLPNQPHVEWPPFSGFWTESLPPNNTIEQEAAGRRYRVTEVRQALFPLSAGKITIEPTKLTIPGDPFTRDVQLESNAVEIDVQPLPDGAPDGFQGAVGHFEMTANVESGQVRVNEPVKLVVQVTGSGNLAMVSDPTGELDSEAPNRQVYESRTTTEVSQDGDTIVGKKTFERLLIPLDAGELTIPAFRLVYYEPTTGEYRSVATGPIAIRVEVEDGATHIGSDAGEQQDNDVRSDNGHTQVSPRALTVKRISVFKRPVYWLVWTLPLLAVISVYVSRRRRRRRDRDNSLPRARDARSLAHEGLSQARRLAREDEDAAYASISRAITDFIGDALGRPSGGLTHDSIANSLSSRGVPPKLVERTLACLNQADSRRFGPPAPGADIRELIDRAAAVIDELDQNLLRP